MSDIIRLLPDHVANQIAAGEVVQRPASVVKELLENSVDSGATTISLVLKDAGRTLVQVTDDGAGMTPNDARLCFERHATSKIRSADELAAVRTKGFRGEALASIAAIAQVELRTRQAADEVGTRVLIEGSRVKAQESIATQPGTQISVRSLFYNVPARRQFLKSDTVEMKHVIEEFQRVALAHPSISMRMLHNEQEVFHLTPGHERHRIVQVFGRKYDERLVPVDEATDLVKVDGFVGKPEFAKRSRGEQFFFVNHRFIRSNYLENAVRRVYDELISRESFPSWFINIEIDPAWIDINIHPTKTEIKFRDDRTVYAIVHAAVRRALGRYNVVPSLDFNTEPAMLASMGVPHVPAVAPIGAVPREEAATPQWRPNDLGRNTRPDGWQHLFEQPAETRRSSITPHELPAEEFAPIPSRAHTESDEEGTAARPVFQLHNRYLLAQLRSGFVVIDQQRAHERIVYERTLHSLERGSATSQAQLFPITVEFNAADHALITGLLPDLHAMGFQMEPLSGRSFSVNGLPADVGEDDPTRSLERFLEQVKNERSALKNERHATLARSMARVLAVREPRLLDERSMHDLIDRLFACEMPYFTPAGKPVLITYSLHDLDERFQR